MNFLFSVRFYSCIIDLHNEFLIIRGRAHVGSFEKFLRQAYEAQSEAWAKDEILAFCI